MIAAGFDEAIKKLRGVRNLESLTEYLREELDWPIADWDIEDLTFEYTPEEAGLDPQSAVKVRSIRRLRPIVTDQPWGIFFIDFVPGDLPITVLRRILRTVVLKKRSFGRPDRQAWQLDDLLFISVLGKQDNRDLNLAHFSEDPLTNRATLRVVEWDEADTHFHMLRTSRELRQLTWRTPGESVEDWRARWASAFALKLGEVPDTAKELASEMARLAKLIRGRVNASMHIESEKGPLRLLHHAFREVLLHDLDADGFADMYAQTLTYGLFAARRSRPMGITADDAKQMVPSTNPFLRDLLTQFTDISGLTKALDFDELGIDALVQMLNRANIDAVVEDFGRAKPGEDPVIHFYEDFLQEYNRKQKIQRGIFYTPRPVVSFIVRSVHEVLQTEFGLEDGLASTATWGDVMAKLPGLNFPEGADAETPFVQILDPAVGTGTFLVEAIDVIYRTMTEKWRKQGHMPLEIPGLWNEYVPNYLLPRLYGFELMMAPYAICHMKIALKLSETGYRFLASERLRIYLTNSLEPPEGFSGQFDIMAPALAHEARAVNEVKRHTRFTVVIGNPPYSASISEPAWLMGQLDDWKRGLNETKSDLNREEWKFLRLGQHLCAASNFAILGFIINRDFLDGIAKRRMREHLAETFPLRIVVDLNGDVKGNISDENVFDIEQGVAIAIFCTAPHPPRLRFASLVGTRSGKYSKLIAKIPVDDMRIELSPAAPYFRWVPLAGGLPASAAAEYEGWLPIQEVFPKKSSGIQTKNDAICIGFDDDELFARVDRLSRLTPKEARQELGISDGGAWTVEGAQNDLRSFGVSREHLRRILYRPFDWRFTYYTHKSGGFLGRPRLDVMQHMLGGRNVGLIFNRQIVGESVSQFCVSRDLICHGTFYLGNKGQDYLAPLYLRGGGLLPANSDAPNLSAAFLSALRGSLRSRSAISPENILGFIYAVFHSPLYRSRYGPFLKIDFPRVPLPASPVLFQELAARGTELVALHLMESPLLASPMSTYVGPTNPTVGAVSWGDSTVRLDETAPKKGQGASPGSIGFHGVPEEVWDFHIGGYQVCEKWLKDRKGRTLTAEDITHYHRIIIALHETIRIMKEIDQVIDAHGGWPAAFQAKNSDGMR